MGNIDDTINQLTQDLDQVIERKPYIQGILDAFRPLILAKVRLLEKMQDKSTTVSPDKLKCRGGIPLIQQEALFPPDDAWQEMAQAVAEAIGTGFPQMAEDMGKLADHLSGGRIDLSGFFHASPVPDEGQVSAWAETIRIAPSILHFFLRSLIRIVLAKRARDLAAGLAALPWDEGYCPLCGSFPMLAMIRDKGQRWLHCSCCGHEWSFPRLKCPYCEHENPEETNYLYVEDQQGEMAFTCEKCRRYLITVICAGSLREIEPDITAIGLSCLDLILQEKDFTPVAVCEWNTF